MRKLLFATIAVLALASVIAAQQANAVQTAADALGAARIKTLQFTGSGKNFSVGQNYTAAEPWPPVPVKNYTALINYDTASMRVELLREMGPVMPRGGGAPFFGEQRQIQLVSGNYAWNVAPAAGNAARLRRRQTRMGSSSECWLSGPHHRDSSRQPWPTKRRRRARVGEPKCRSPLAASTK